MFCETHGTGARIFLGLHGWGGDHTVFAPLASHVPAAAALYAADLPGCGCSTPPREWSMKAIVDNIVATISQLVAQRSGDDDDGEVPERVTIIGHCGGAIFGLLAAQRLPEIIERVVMVDPFAYLPRYFRLFVGENFGRRAYQATFANSFGRWLTNQALSTRREGDADLTASFATTNHEHARRYLTLFAEMGGVEQFADVRADVDLVRGEKSFGAVKKSIAMLQATLLHARVYQLEEAGHLPFAEATAQISRIIFETSATHTSAKK